MMGIWKMAGAVALVCSVPVFSGAALAQQKEKSPPKLPANYRILLSAEFGPEYLLFNGSDPKISKPRTGKGLLYENVGLCVQVAPSLSYRVYGTRPLNSEDGKVDFKKERFGGGCFGEEMGPFPELVQMGQKLRRCAARGESHCLMLQIGSRRYFAEIPKKLLRGKS